MGSNLVEVQKFFSGLICNILNRNYHCDDHLQINIVFFFLTIICDPPQDFDAKGESTLSTRFNFKTKNLF